MEFTLLKAATEVIVEREQTDRAVKMIAHNLLGFEIVYESAEEFLMQIFAKARNQGTFTPEEVQRMAPIAAALQLISSADTRDSIMAKFKGDEQKNLVTISKGVTKPNAPPGKIDQVLIQIGQTSARTLVDKITSILNDPQSPDRERLSSDVQKLAGWYRSQPGNLEKTQPIPITPAQKMTPMNQQQSGGASAGQTGTAAPASGGAAASPAAGPTA
jgi:hypothetical protein